MRLLPLAAALLLAWTGTAHATPDPAPAAELIHLTVDGSENGAPLLPGFPDHSVWSALGRASNGKIFFAVSNHQRPGGNVALYRYDPAVEEIVTLGDVMAISSAAGNWMTDESQYKIHTFLMEHSDGQLYAITMDHEPTPFLRGAHVYRIDPDTETVEDFSQNLPFLMTDSLQVIPNTGQNAAQSGVLIETYGVKGMGLHPGAPDLLYAMTYPDGHLIQYRFSDGNLKVVGQSEKISYVFHVDAEGDVYYTDSDAVEQTLYKYDASADTTLVIEDGLPAASSGGVGAIAPTADGRYVYFLLHHTQEVWLLDRQTDSFTFFADTCGTNWWRMFNLHLSPDEQSLYFVSNNNPRSTIRRIDVATGACSEVLDVDALLGPRDLCFGGTGVWDADGHFYAPVWQSGVSEPEPALLKVKVELPEPGSVAGLAAGAAALAALRARRRMRQRSAAGMRSGGADVPL